MSFLDRPHWHRLALCAGTSPDVFHPGRGTAMGPIYEVCRACAFRAVCIAQGVESTDTRGVWGGLSEKSRRRLRSGGTVTTSNGDRIDWDADTGTVTIIDGSTVLDPADARALLKSLQPDAESAPLDIAL